MDAEHGGIKADPLQPAWLNSQEEEPRYDPALIEAYNVPREEGTHATAWARGMLWLASDDQGDATGSRRLAWLLAPSPAGTLMLPTGAAESTIVWWENG